MLPPAHRLRDGDGFAAAVRRGRRAAGHELVVHLGAGDPPLLVGFVVSRAVGNAVQRNRVKRRLRHLVAERLATPGALPAGGTLVVRARPAAAQAGWAELGQALDRCLARVREEADR